MSVQDFVNAIVEFVKANDDWAMPIAFVVAFLESFCFLSIIWPGTAILIGISALLAKSGVGLDVLWPAIVAASIGGTLGYAVSYWIGLYYKDDIHKLWPFNRKPELVERGEAFFAKWGALGVFFGHFFGPVRAVIPVVAGMYSMPQWQFQLVNVLSAAIWAAGIIAPTYFGLSYFLE
ncbi:DedA family protein [Hyphomicrobium sp.]|uniref:DedA family protein n=1 Tax=Hyphomicrobium sp. TaxID=82 RepID=UPI000FB3E122|nr:DedA family protein [Hyphomicrobium sp.]MBN9246203.1 DedA family protein [Hyphomicrobium sp.]RUP09199.1 MAG: DedA family protein [Hyphomicrobium sp.]